MKWVVVFAGAGWLIAQEPTLVGSGSCRSCHSAIYDSYMRTPMATSSGAAGDGRTAEDFRTSTFEHTASGYFYQVQPGEGGYTLEWWKARDPKGERFTKSMPFYVGSAAIARSYLLQREGFLYQSPVAYYAAEKKWDLAPGYSRYNQPFLNRPVLPGCLQCHASGVQHRPLTQNGYASPPFEEGGVACERCHGPGGAHIATMKSKGKGQGTKILNPSKLDAERRDSVCSQCHLTGEVRFPRAGRSASSFQAGESLQDHLAVLVRAGAPGEMRVTSHVENLAQSACKQNSGDRLWCGTCHDPHTVPNPMRRVSWYRSKCLTCHQMETCKAPAIARKARNDDCSSCHMPRNPVTDAQHVVYTDHSIPRLSRVSLPVAPVGDSVLAPFGEAQLDQRDLGIGYAIVAQRENSAILREKALQLLQSAKQKDAELLLYLADIYNQRSERAKAIPLYEEAIRRDPAQLTGSVSLGAIRMEQGEYSEAIRLWQDALRKNPALPLVRGNLAAALLKVGQKVEAEAVLRRAVEFNPEFVAPRWLTDQLSAQ